MRRDRYLENRKHTWTRTVDLSFYMFDMKKSSLKISIAALLFSVKVVRLGRWVGLRGLGQGHCWGLPVVWAACLGHTHPLCLPPLVSVTWVQAPGPPFSRGWPWPQGGSGGPVFCVPPVHGRGGRELWPAISPGKEGDPWQGSASYLKGWRHERQHGHREHRQPLVSGGARLSLHLLLSPRLWQRVESQESGAGSQEAVSPGDQSVHWVLQTRVLLLQLVKIRQTRGNVKSARLLHEEPAALLPVSLQELLRGPGLVSGHGVSLWLVRTDHVTWILASDWCTVLSLASDWCTVLRLASDGERDTDQLSRALNGVRGVRANLALKNVSVRTRRSIFGSVCPWKQLEIWIKYWHCDFLSSWREPKKTDKLKLSHYLWHCTHFSGKSWCRI